LDQNEKHDERAFLKTLRSVGPDTTPSPGFEEALLGRLLDKVADQHAPMARKTRKLRTPVWVIRIAPAVAATLLLAVGLWWMFGGHVREASAGFAEMLQNIRQAATVAFDLTCRVQGEPVSRAQVQAAYPGRTRVTWRDDGRIHIVDAAKQKILALTPATMTANLRPVTDQADYDDPLERLRNAGDSAGQAVGTETWDNREVVVYQVEQGPVTLRVWVDAEEELPVLIESKSHADDGQESVVILDNIQWNLPICESQFSLEVPAGYTEAQPSETDLVELLRICARISGGSFPQELNGPAVLDLIKAGMPGQVYCERSPEGRGATTMSHEGKAVFKACLRGLTFVAVATEDGNWHYSGSGVKLGDATAVVCWWRPTGSTTPRAVYGDLTIRELTSD